MKNYFLSITSRSIPYFKELKVLAKSVTGCILMQQLDYWFSHYPDGFFKFLDKAPNHADYKPGDSWTEELEFSVDEFRTAFDRIGIRYASKTSFANARNKFVTESGEEKFYCSYFDKSKGKTWYFRNHELLDSALDEVLRASRKSPSTGDGKSPSLEKGISHLRSSEKSIPILYTKNTQEITHIGEPPVPQVPQSPPPTPCACGQDCSIPSTPVQPNQDSLNSLTPPPTAGKDGAAASLDSYRVDRTAESFAQRANIPSYRTSRSENGVKPEFLTYLSATYLPSTPHWREQAKEGNPPSLADAKKWIRDRERGGKGAEVSDRYEAFLEWQDKQVSGQKNTNPHWEAYLAEQEARTEAAKEKWSRIALEQKQATTEQ